MPLNVQLVNAQVKDPQSGQMTPAGLIGSDAISTINTAKNQAVAAIEKKGEDVIDSIPPEYTDLTNEVDGLKTQKIDKAKWAVKAEYIDGVIISGENLFETCELFGERGYARIVDGKLVWTNYSSVYPNYNGYLLPVEANTTYSFTYARFWALIDSDKETVLSDEIMSYATTINSSNASYIYFSFDNSIYPTESYKVVEGTNINVEETVTLPGWLDPHADDIDNCVKKDGTEEVETKNISGMTETSEFIDSDNIFSTDFLKYSGKYPYISESTGKVVYGPNAAYNTYLIPVSGAVYNFTSVAYGVLLDADQETAVGSWIQNTTTINTSGASYLAFSFNPSVYTPANYVVTEKQHIWETPKTWRLRTIDYPKYVSKNGSIASGDSFSIDDIGLALLDGYIATFKGYITSFESIKFGFGFAPNAITVDETNVTIKNGYTADVVLPHGLTIAHELTIIFELIKGDANITICSNGGLFKTTVRWVQLNASNGSPTIISTNTVMTDCELRIIVNATNRNIWYLGDSYISVGSNERWTYYLNQYGWFTKTLFQGMPGMYSVTGVTALKRLLRFGKPKIVVFATGMNDGTDDSAPRANWSNARDEFISICESNGIEPIFGTVPTVPNINNEQKNAWIRASGYRYIDFAKAVGASSSGVWYSGMLSGDNVHPTEKGAKALFTQAISDLPELMLTD